MRFFIIPVLLFISSLSFAKVISLNLRSDVWVCSTDKDDNLCYMTKGISKKVVVATTPSSGQEREIGVTEIEIIPDHIAYGPGDPIFKFTLEILVRLFEQNQWQLHIRYNSPSFNGENSGRRNKTIGLFNFEELLPQFNYYGEGNDIPWGHKLITPFVTISSVSIQE